jgi:hypothetical protein
MLAALGLAACGSSSGSGGGVGPPPPVPPVAGPPANPPANPPVVPGPGTGPLASLGQPKLTPMVDASRQSTLTIGAAGGELSAQASDGSRYRLVVPPGALAAPIEITMRPVDAIGGLPLTGGLRAAVELLPAGLSFAQPALLIIAPVTTAAGVTAAFGWSGAENAFTVAKAMRSSDGKRTSFEITHFSGYGVALPGPSELEGLYADLTALIDEEEPFRDDWGPAIRLYLDSDDTTALFALFVKWHDEIVAPLIANAGRSPADAILAHHALETWLAYVTVFFDYSSPELSEDVRERWAVNVAVSIGVLVSHFNAYTRPNCSATVPEWKDWLRVPETLRIAQLEFVEADHPSVEFTFRLFPEKYCVSLELRETAFPLSLDADTATLPLSFSTVVMLPDGTGVPVPGHVTLTYSDGLTGEASLDTSAGGALATLIDRDPLGPLRATVEVVVTETDAARPDVFRVQERFTVGSLDIYFAENLDPAPRPILGFGEDVDVCAYVAVGPPVGQTVEFELTGQGTLSATSAVTVDALGVGQACVVYTSPFGYVTRDLTFEIKATTASPDGEISDVLRLHPNWIEILLETDVGLGRVNATNQGFSVDGDGPFTVHAHVVGPYDTTAIPPGPVDPGLELLATTAEPVLVTADGGRSDFDVVFTNDDGTATFQVGLSSGSAPSHTIEVRTVVGDDDVASGAAVSFYRSLPTLGVEFTSHMPGSARVPLIVRALSSSGSPHSNVYIELEATGGTLGTSSGYTNAQGELRTTARLAIDSNEMTIGIKARRAPDAEIYDAARVSGFRGAIGRLGLTGRRERATSNSAIPNQAGDGYLNTCGFNQNPAACRLGTYGPNSYTAVAGGSASFSHNLEGSLDTGLLAGTAEINWSAGASSSVAETQVQFTVTTAPVPIRVRLECASGGGTGVSKISGNVVERLGAVSGQPDPGLPEPNYPILFGGGVLSVDFIGVVGASYRVEAQGAASICPAEATNCGAPSGSCSYEITTGDAIDYGE